MIRFNLKSFLSAVFVLFISLSLTACDSGSAKSKVINIKFSHVASPDTPKGKASLFFKKEVERLSNGRVKVTVYPNSQLYRDSDAVTALLMDSVQIICPSTSKLTTVVPELQVVDLPYLFPSMDKVHKAFDGKFGGMVSQLLKKKKYKTLAYWDGAYKQLGNNKRAIKKPKDARGLKFRIMSSKVLEAQFRHIGANPQVLPFSEVYTALEQGVIDGQENTWFNTYSQKFYEVQKEITETKHGYLGYVLLTSSIFWSSLPPEIKPIIMKAVKSATEFERKVAEEIEIRDRTRILDSGKTNITTLTPSEKILWIEKFRQIYKKYPEWKDLISAATR